MKSDHVNDTRLELIEYFKRKPVKWKNSSPQDIHFVLDLVMRNALPCATLHIQRNNPAWGNYWKDARKFHEDLLKGIREQAKKYKFKKNKDIEFSKPSFAKPGKNIRYHILAKTEAILIAVTMEHIWEFNRGTIINSHGFLPLLLNITFDIEMQDQESQEFFRDINIKWFNTTDQKTIKDISPKIINVSFKQEEDEPLLLIPDFIAGVLHQKLLDSEGVRSQLRPVLIKAASELKIPPSKYFEVQKEPFTEQFPYVIKNGRAVLKQSPEINL